MDGNCCKNSDDLKIAFELPGGDVPLKLVDLPAAGLEEMLHKSLAKELPRYLGTGHTFRRHRQRRCHRLCPCRFGLKIEFMLDAIQPAGQRRGDAKVRVDVRTGDTGLEARRRGRSRDNT